VALLYGWGRETWSSGPWGEPAALAVTGVEAAGAISSASVVISTTEEVTGVEAAGAIGTVTTVTDSLVVATGVESVGAIASVTVTTEIVTLVTGVEAVGGITSVGLGFTFPVTGVEAVGIIKTPNVWSVVDTTQDANWVPIAA
tara:strand:- start:15 stop:443 length:429 start_codon:yes stop_codon:yes gene_type:complete